MKTHTNKNTMHNSGIVALHEIEAFELWFTSVVRALNVPCDELIFNYELRPRNKVNTKRIKVGCWPRMVNPVTHRWGQCMMRFMSLSLLHHEVNEYTCYSVFATARDERNFVKVSWRGIEVIAAYATGRLREALIEEKVFHNAKLWGNNRSSLAWSRFAITGVHCFRHGIADILRMHEMIWTERINHLKVLKALNADIPNDITRVIFSPEFSIKLF